MALDKRPVPLKGKVLSIEELGESVKDSVPQTVEYSKYRELEMMLNQAQLEIAELRMLLSKVSDIALPVTDEEEIASIQLQKIKQLSRERELTLEEIKKYDLLVKNKRLAQGDVTDITASKELPKNLGKSDLLRIATKK